MESPHYHFLCCLSRPPLINGGLLVTAKLQRAGGFGGVRDGSSPRLLLAFPALQPVRLDLAGGEGDFPSAPGAVPHGALQSLLPHCREMFF